MASQRLIWPSGGSHANYGTDVALTNPTSVSADDSVYATASVSSTPAGQKYGNWGWDAIIPAGATITDVQLEYQWKGTRTAGNVTGRTFARIGGTDQTVHSSALKTVTFADVVEGPTSIFADRAWTRADLLDGTFEMVIRGAPGGATSFLLSWDYIAVTVFWDVPGGHGDELTVPSRRSRLVSMVRRRVARIRLGFTPPATTQQPRRLQPQSRRRLITKARRLIVRQPIRHAPRVTARTKQVSVAASMRSRLIARRRKHQIVHSKPAKLPAALTIAPSSVIHSRAFGTPKLNLQILGASVVHSRAVGTAQLNLKLTPLSVVHSRAFGTPKLNLTIFISSAVHSRAVGSPAVVNGQFVSPGSVVHARATGTPKLNLTLYATTTIHSRAIGTPKLNLQITPSSVVHSRAVGTARLNLMVLGSSVVHSRAIGAVKVNLTVTCSSITHARAVGTPQVTLALHVPSVVHSRGIGTATIEGGVITVLSVVHGRGINTGNGTSVLNIAPLGLGDSRYAVEGVFTGKRKRVRASPFTA